MGLSKTQEKEYAKILYVNEKLTQKEIAERVNVTEKTVGKWIEAGGWNKLRQSLLATKPHNIDLLYQALTVLNESFQGSVPTPSQIDSVAKLTASIKNLETDLGLGEIFTVGTNFIQFVRNNSPEKVKEVYNLFDAFIQHKRNG